MARPTRQEVTNALWALLEDNVAGIKTYSKRFTMPQACKPGDLPTLMLYTRPETIENPGLATPAKKFWTYWLVVVFRNPDKAIAGDTILNPILDSIEDAMAPSGPGFGAFGAQTLGGLVYQAKIEGAIHRESGDIDSDGLGGAVIPINVLNVSS